MAQDFQGTQGLRLQGGFCLLVAAPQDVLLAAEFRSQRPQAHPNIRKFFQGTLEQPHIPASAVASCEARGGFNSLNKLALSGLLCGYLASRLPAFRAFRAFSIEG